jgi:hypothetical protein
LCLPCAEAHHLIMPFTPGTRRIFERFAQLACPPELVTAHLMPALVDEFERHLACLPAAARRTVAPTLFLFNQAARLRRGRCFVGLDQGDAEAYFSNVLYRRQGALSAAVRLVKGLVVMCYYELPAVKAQLGYHPEAYIAGVAARRLERYGHEIEAASREGER